MSQIHHATGSDVFAGAGIVDLRHDLPTSTEAALRRVAATLRNIFLTAVKGELSYRLAPDESRLTLISGGAQRRPLRCC